jgi:hypothetical protein
LARRRVKMEPCGGEGSDGKEKLVREREETGHACVYEAVKGGGGGADATLTGAG